jgi:hypothetical protein
MWSVQLSSIALAGIVVASSVPAQSIAPAEARAIAKDAYARDADGGLTLLIQNESPGKDKEANWLPAPKGPFMMVMRLYCPKEEAVEGKWTAPQLRQAK